MESYRAIGGRFDARLFLEEVFHEPFFASAGYLVCLFSYFPFFNSAISRVLP
jgi:hypothetical protein